jgi:phosphomannomutase
MAEKKNELETAGEGKVIFSYEESYGYMMGDYVRDKDAVTASMLLTEMAAWYADQGHDPVRRHRRRCTKNTAITLKRPTIW